MSTSEDVAIDWVTGNIYFTDSSYKRIGVCDENGTYCTVVIKENIEKPRAIVLSSKSGLHFFLISVYIFAYKKLIKFFKLYFSYIIENECAKKIC